MYLGKTVPGPGGPSVQSRGVNDDADYKGSADYEGFASFEGFADYEGSADNDDAGNDPRQTWGLQK